MASDPRWMRWVLGALLLGTSAPLAAQEKPAAQDVNRKVIRLFNEISGHLDTIDRLLFEASTRRSAEESAAALEKLNKLLEQAEGREGEVISKIEEIIRIVPRQPGGGGGGSSGQTSKSTSPPKKDGQPQDPGDQANPDKRDEKPQPLEGQPSGRKPANGPPESSEESPARGRNTQGAERPKKDPLRRDDARGSWEVQLPRRQGEVFRNRLKDTQIPSRYHKWIERWRSIHAQGGR